MKRREPVEADGLFDKLKNLPHLDRNTLIEQWTRYFGEAPPARTSRPLMVRAVAYKMQERASGGLKPAIRRTLLQEPACTPAPTRALGAGTVLLREWQGVTHQVTVAEVGIVYRGKLYRSLSEVARLITNSHWSGPRFFGLKKHDRR